VYLAAGCVVASLFQLVLCFCFCRFFIKRRRNLSAVSSRRGGSVLIMDTYRGERDLEVELPLSLREGDGMEISTDSSSSERSSLLSLIAQPKGETDSDLSLGSFSSFGEGTGLLEDRGEEDDGVGYLSSSLLPLSSRSLPPSFPIHLHTRAVTLLSLSQSRSSPEGQSSSCSSTSSPPPPPSALMAD
jgi:hypothetical protein